MIGENLTQPTVDAKAGLLNRHCGVDGKEYVYVQAASAIAAGDVVAIDETGQAALVTKARADDGHKIGVAQVAFADNDYGYVQVKGVCIVNVLANCAADVALYSSATSGSLDDTDASQTKILGIVATAAVGGSAGSVAGWMAADPVADL